MQDVTNDGPAWLAGRGVLPQDPVPVDRVERAVLPLQSYPGVDEANKPLVSLPDRVRERDADRLGARHDHGVFRKHERPRGPAFCREQQRVHPGIVQRQLEIVLRLNFQNGIGCELAQLVDVVRNVGSGDHDGAELPNRVPTGERFAAVVEYR